MEKEENKVKGNSKWIGKAHHSIAFKKEIVKKIEDGQTRRELGEEYSLVHTTISNWVRLYRSQGSELRIRRIYKPSERRSILRAYESGLSAAELKATFDVNWKTIKSWVYAAKKKKNDLSVTNIPVVMVKKRTNTETDDLKSLKKALADAELKVKALETMIDIAEEELKINIRKKSGARQSSK